MSKHMGHMKSTGTVRTTRVLTLHPEVIEQGDFFNCPKTGRKVNFNHCNLLPITDGTIVHLHALGHNYPMGII